MKSFSWIPSSFNILSCFILTLYDETTFRKAFHILLGLIFIICRAPHYTGPFCLAKIRIGDISEMSCNVPVIFISMGLQYTFLYHIQWKLQYSQPHFLPQIDEDPREASILRTGMTKLHSVSTQVSFYYISMGALDGGSPCRFYKMLMSHVSVACLCPCRMLNLRNCPVACGI